GWSAPPRDVHARRPFVSVFAGNPGSLVVVVSPSGGSEQRRRRPLARLRRRILPPADQPTVHRPPSHPAEPPRGPRFRDVPFVVVVAACGVGADHPNRPHLHPTTIRFRTCPLPYRRQPNRRLRNLDPDWGVSTFPP